MEKKNYTEPMCEIVKNDVCDVLTASIIMPPDYIGRNHESGYPEL